IIQDERYQKVFKQRKENEFIEEDEIEEDDDWDLDYEPPTEDKGLRFLDTIPMKRKAEFLLIADGLESFVKKITRTQDRNSVYYRKFSRFLTQAECFLDEIKLIEEMSGQETEENELECSEQEDEDEDEDEDEQEEENEDESDDEQEKEDDDKDEDEDSSDQEEEEEKKGNVDEHEEEEELVVEEEEEEEEEEPLTRRI
ncbi:hypothetical protein BGZ65_012397, partial [Modicella reniformis]